MCAMAIQVSYDAVIRELIDEYHITAREDVRRLRYHLERFRASGGKSRREAVKAIYHIAHDVKGQGGSFGYDMMTDIGGALCHYLRPWYEGRASTALQMRVIERHIDALEHVISHKIRGPADADGKILLDTLVRIDPVAMIG